MSAGARQPGAPERLSLRELRDSYRYGYVLALSIVSLAFQMGASDRPLSKGIALLLEAATLGMAFWVSPSSGRARRMALGLLLLGVVAAGVAAAEGSSSATTAMAAIVGLLLMASAAAAIARGVVLGIRSWGQVTLQAAFGALSIYLLVGLCLACGYDALGALSSQPIFAAGQVSDHPNDVYFSFITLTTVGYGDFAPVNRLARTLAVIEALTGQLYLVTIVALIVGNVGRRAPSNRRGQASP